MASFKKAPKIQSQRQRTRKKLPTQSRATERRTLVYAAGIAVIVIVLLYFMFTSV